MASLPSSTEKPPKRPPNAWILFRKDHIHKLPPLPPGAPRRTQTEVSQILSHQWKNASDEVKAYYERRAEIAKQEHFAKYPNYKFAPQSKADKERKKKELAAQRELRRANGKRGRARPAPYVAPVVTALPPSHPTSYTYDPVVMYGDGGPSPHLSAASSPTSSKSSSLPLPAVSPRYRTPYSSTPSSPGSDAYQNSPHHPSRLSMTPEVYTGSMPPATAPNEPLPGLIRQHLPYPNQYQPPSQPPQQQLTGFTGELVPWMHNPSHSNELRMGSEEFTSAHTQWPSAPVQIQGVQQAIAFGTSDPSIYSLEGGQSFTSFLEDPRGELEVALAPAQSYSDPQAAAQYAYFASLFTEYDYSQPNGGSPPHATDGGSGGSSGVMSPVEAVAASNFFNDDVSQVTLPTVTQQGVMSPVTPSPFMNNMIQGSHTSSGAPSPTVPLQQQHIIPSFGQETFQQYFNFDIPADMSLDLNATSPRSTHGFSQPMPVVDYNSQRTSPTQQIPYVPPVGAAHSGARRVGGSWRPPQPEFDSQAEHSPAGTWPYPVPARS